MDFTPKRAGETEIFTVDFANLLAPDETIVSANWACSVVTGTDPNPSAMLQGGASVTGKKVSQMITGGIAGNTYAPVCTAVTSLGQTLELPEYGNGSLQVTP